MVKGCSTWPSDGIVRECEKISPTSRAANKYRNSRLHFTCQISCLLAVLPIRPSPLPLFYTIFQVGTCHSLLHVHIHFYCVSLNTRKRFVISRYVIYKLSIWNQVRHTIFDVKLKYFIWGIPPSRSWVIAKHGETRYPSLPFMNESAILEL